MQLRSEALPDVDGVWVRPADARGATGTGVLVLSGSSGRVETQRATVLAGVGATALSYRWFGAPGQPHGIWELPLESFDWAVGRLAPQCDRVVLVGVSKSAEAFLLYAADDPRVDAVVALSPSHVAWAAVSPGPDGELRPQHSSWSRAGRALPYVPYDDDVAVTGDPPAFEPVYRTSLDTFADRVEAATIPVERFFGDVLLVAGGDDRVWPALDFARAVEARRTAYGLPTTLVTHPDAGHRVILPGEGVAAGGAAMQRGGTEPADRALGLLAWPEIRRVLGAPEH
ncbi:bile acid acyltransferase/acyl-CoA thioester hydrolase-like protein [Humibacillus xanthopallidus]|uniref:Bile acid acyltransferase/acyl-CoA thioester hydrolase-like protein n=1 Tax=Humibacillus xanthopallidus TaxID=412689 RepID=A0A543PP64_9MICO|nr:acyl-CoA thioester hydrolase/BAAT C-terminal domain-containing protein [Humibacillus xanthopallidus]TQN45869.1 bile acid acyltransferase/acyl-CoA thioester hydrolase-like protein [Humibacillus xanthopallidus]